MKKLLLVAVAFIFALTAFSQDPPYSDNFDAFVPGEYIAEQIPDWWTTWSNDPGSSEDAQFSDAVSHSGDNSVLVDGTTDLVWKLGDKTGGYYLVDFYFYVEDGFAGYYNFQHIQSGLLRYIGMPMELLMFMQVLLTPLHLTILQVHGCIASISSTWQPTGLSFILMA